jgi:hypothetical protein
MLCEQWKIEFFTSSNNWHHSNTQHIAGFLTECYDELGTRYQVPVYCLSYPINIVKEDGRDSPAECSGCIDVPKSW